MQQNKDYFDNQRSSSSLPLPPPPPPPTISASPRHHHQDGYDGDTCSRRGNFQGRSRGHVIHGIPGPANYDSGGSVNHRTFSSFHGSSDVHENQSTIDTSYRNLFSRNPSPSAVRFPRNSPLPARASEAPMMLSRDKISHKSTDFVNRERKQSRSNIALQQTGSENVSSRHLYAAEIGRPVEDYSEPKRDLKALLDRFDDFGGLENVLKTGIGKQHLTQCLRQAIELHGPTTERFIDDRLDLSTQSSKRLVVDDRLDYRRDNFEPRSKWMGTESSIQRVHDDNTTVSGERGECFQSREYSVKPSASEDDAFHGLNSRMPALNTRTRALNPPAEVRGLQNVRPVDGNAFSNFPDRRMGAHTAEVDSSDFTYGGFQPSRFQTNQLQDAYDDSPGQPAGFPLCERGADELSRDSDAGYCNLSMRNVKNAPAVPIPEELPLYMNEESKNLLLRETDDSLSGKIDLSYYEHQREEKAMHHDINYHEPTNYRLELISEDYFTRQDFDNSETGRNTNVGLTLRSRLSASPGSNVNIDLFPVGDDIAGPDHPSSTSSHLRIHKSTSKRSLSSAQNLARCANTNIRDRLDESPVRSPQKARGLKNRSPVFEARRMDARANSPSLKRDVGKVSGRNTHHTKEDKRRSDSLSRDLSGRIQSSILRKVRSPSGTGKSSLRGYSLSPHRKANGSSVAVGNRSGHSHSRSPVHPSRRSFIRSRCRSPFHEGTRSSVSRARIESPEHLRKKSTEYLRKRSPGRLRNKSTEHSRNRSPKSLRERSPRRPNLSIQQRLGAESPVNRTRDRALPRRSLSPHFSRTEFGRSPRLAHNSPIGRRSSPGFDGFDHRFGARKSPVQLRRSSWNSPIRSLRRRSLDPLEPVHLSPGPAFRRLSPRASPRSSPRRPVLLLPPERAALESFPKSPLRLPATSRLHRRSPRPGLKNSPARRSPLRKHRRTQSPGAQRRVSPSRSQRSPRRPLTSRSTHKLARESSSTKIEASRKDNSPLPPRTSSSRIHSRVLSRLSPRRISSDLLPGSISYNDSLRGSSPVTKSIRSNKSPLRDGKLSSSQRTSRADRRIGSPRRNPRSPKPRTTHSTSQRSSKQKLSPQSSRKKAVFDRLSSKDSTSLSDHNAQLNKGTSTSSGHSSKFPAPLSKNKSGKVSVRDRLGEKKIEEEIDEFELKVVDEVSINTSSDSKNEDEDQHFRDQKGNVRSGTKRSVGSEQLVSAAEPVKKKKNFVPIVFSAADFEEKPSTTRSLKSDDNKKKFPPRGGADHGVNRKDTHSRRPRTSESFRDPHVSNKLPSHDTRSSDRTGKSASSAPSRRVAPLSSHAPKKNKDVKEMSLAELRDEIAKFGGDSRAARASTSREELRLLLLQAKEEQVEKKLRRLDGSARR